MPGLAKNHSAHKKRIWEYWMCEFMKTKRILESNICKLFAVLMSLCDSDAKNQVESMNELSNLEARLDTITPLESRNRYIPEGQMT